MTIHDKVKAFLAAEQLPAGYTRLQYLESGGQQYINTQIIPTLNTSFETEIADISNLTYSLFGVKNGTLTTTNSGFGVLLNNSKFGFFRNGHSLECINQDKNFHYYYLSNNDAILDGVHYSFAAHDEPINISRPMYVFGFNHVTAYDKSERVKYVKIFENGILTRYLIPARRNSDNVLGMYDKVSDTLFTNSGSGSFTAGPDA